MVDDVADRERFDRNGGTRSTYERLCGLDETSTLLVPANFCGLKYNNEKVWMKRPYTKRTMKVKW